MNEIAKEFCGQFVGRQLSVIKRHEHSWFFGVSDKEGVLVQSPWRVLAADRIAVTDADDGHRFGLSAPVDAETSAKALLGSNPVLRAEIDPITADLTLTLDNATRLQVLSNSAGYEAWTGWLKSGAQVIALGGGDLAAYPGSKPVATDQDR